MQHFENEAAKMRKCFTKFSCIFEFGAVQKFVNLVDLVKSFPTTIYLQRFVSIQPRASLSKFAKKSPKVRKKLETSQSFLTEIRRLFRRGLAANGYCL